MLSQDGRKGMRRWLLGRRSRDGPDDLAFYQAYGPEETPVGELVRICKQGGRWRKALLRLKRRGGLGSLRGKEMEDLNHRYVTLCLLAHAYLIVTRLSARSEQEEEVRDKRGIAILPS